MACVLVIDDDATFRKSLQLILQRKGHSVLEAKDGNQGIEIIEQNKDIDIILMDVVMPLKDGIETLIDLRDRIDELKIIIMSGKVAPDSEAFQNLTTTLGAKKILYKPFDSKVLLQAIDEILAS